VPQVQPPSLTSVGSSLLELRHPAHPNFSCAITAEQWRAVLRAQDRAQFRDARSGSGSGPCKPTTSALPALGKQQRSPQHPLSLKAVKAADRAAAAAAASNSEAPVMASSGWEPQVQLPALCKAGLVDVMPHRPLKTRFPSLAAAGALHRDPGSRAKGDDPGSGAGLAQRATGRCVTTPPVQAAAPLCEKSREWLRQIQVDLNRDGAERGSKVAEVPKGLAVKESRKKARPSVKSGQVRALAGVILSPITL
jgi:hypothetical protein